MVESNPDGAAKDGSILSDYDLNTPISTDQGGLRSNLPGYGDAHFSLFLRKVFIKALGYTDESLSKPIIGIINTFSSFNPCHAQVPQLIEATKRGILSAGGLPMEFPTISIHESFANPTSMYLRNLMSMDTEEMVRAQPVDAVVMIGGCDKTVPAQLMGGISANKPFLPLITGPMMPGSVKGVRVGACTDCRNNWAKFRAGELDIEDIMDVNEELAPTAGTCGVMGTASTMACVAAGLGLVDLRAGATSPAVSSARLRVAETTGRQAVKMLEDAEAFRPQRLLAYENFVNAIVVLQAIGGSTNAVVHLLALANRHPAVRGRVTLRTFDDVGAATPLLVDLKPSGDGYMTDFHRAGGMLALMHALRPLLHLGARTFTGEPLGAVLDAAPFAPFAYSRRVVRPLADPLYARSSLAVLYGNLAPRGAVIKASASKDRRLLCHRGRACVFRDSRDLSARVDAEDLGVAPDSVLVLQGVGPVGHPGMPEAGLVPIPRKLARRGVADMLRLSDGRMSGTAGGTIVLHVAPEAADPASVLGVVRDGDFISCDVPRRRLHLEVDDAEIARRIELRRQETATAAAALPGRRDVWEARKTTRGYRGLYERHVNQADEGCDFDFLTADGPANT
ncbi:dihydroxy-acid dehydratase [Durotheca rogersii]|uniref:dihydroxy-acid dehydratase n=1 Tax=Durotheca rogersii TaxID=419775 RepID=UPI002220D28E|nr:dihydroxy-acid dehydratase [Durotheca rogersii]KAI5867371.1 dihydroxy-acid dehydratase [Durotheca rogersii]